MHDANSVDDITKKCFEPNNQVKFGQRYFDFFSAFGMFEQLKICLVGYWNIKWADSIKTHFVPIPLCYGTG